MFEMTPNKERIPNELYTQAHKLIGSIVSVRACAHTRKQLAAEMRLSWLDDDAKVLKDRQEGGTSDWDRSKEGQEDWLVGF